MIKLFRHIRQNLIMENKTGKYFKYAIGEIILVVIGILIALQINNWNEQRKDRLKEQVILKQLKEDYLSNLRQLEEKMMTRTNMINSGLQILKSFDQPEVVVFDSLTNNMAIISSDPTFDPIQNDLISSGNLRLINNEKLKRLLSNWSSDVIALKEIEVVWSNIANNRLEEVLTEIGLTRDVTNSYLNDVDHTWLLDNNLKDYKKEIGKSKLSSPITEIVTNRKLESMASSAISYNISANIQSEALVKRINEIMNLIDSAIIE